MADFTEIPGALELGHGTPPPRQGMCEKRVMLDMTRPAQSQIAEAVATATRELRAIGCMGQAAIAVEIVVAVTAWERD